MPHSDLFVAGDLPHGSGPDAVGAESRLDVILGDEIAPAMGEAQCLVRERKTKERQRRIGRGAGQIRDRRHEGQRATAHERTHRSVGRGRVEQARDRRRRMRALLRLADPLPEPHPLAMNTSIESAVLRWITCRPQNGS